MVFGILYDSKMNFALFNEETRYNSIDNGLSHQVSVNVISYMISAIIGIFDQLYGNTHRIRSDALNWEACLPSFK